MLDETQEERLLRSIEMQLTEGEAHIAPEIIRSIRLGDEMKRFSQSPVGKYILDRAAAQISDASETLLRQINLQSEESIRAHRDGYVANLVLDWFDDALIAAREARKFAEQTTEDEHYG